MQDIVNSALENAEAEQRDMDAVEVGIHVSLFGLGVLQRGVDDILHRLHLRPGATLVASLVLFV